MIEWTTHDYETARRRGRLGASQPSRSRHPWLLRGATLAAALGMWYLLIRLGMVLRWLLWGGG